jgi:hypothetical protein
MMPGILTHCTVSVVLQINQTVDILSNLIVEGNEEARSRTT